MDNDALFEKERMRHRVEGLLNDFLQAGTTHPTIAYATRKPGNHEQGTAYATRSAAAGGSHEHKD